MLPITTGLEPRIDPKTKIKLHAAVGGYSVLQSILNSNPSEYAKLLWTKCQDMPVWIGSVKFSDTLDDLLHVFEKTRFGNAVVEDTTREHSSLVTLKEIMSLYRVGKLKSSVQVSEIGSERISISSDSTITDAIKLMFKKRIRRVFHSGLQFTSSRDIIRFLLSPHRLEMVKKTPELWLDAKLSDVLSGHAEPIPDDATIIEAVKCMGGGVDSCLVCVASKQVVSRWDIVMKPWKMGRMET